MTEFSLCGVTNCYPLFSWQVNGSDGMYKYEEIILERVSFTLELVTFLSTQFACHDESPAWGVDFCPLGGSNQLSLSEP